MNAFFIKHYFTDIITSLCEITSSLNISLPSKESTFITVDMTLIDIY